MPTAPYRSLADRAIAVIAPWNVWHYPGKRRALAQIIGVGISSARIYLRGQAQLPSRHAEALACYLERSADEQTRVARLLRDHARKHGEQVRRLRGRALVLASQAGRDEDRPV